MFYSTLEDNESKLNALTLEFERLNETVDGFFKECDLSYDAIAHFNSTRAHFTDEAWQRLQEERTKLEEKLKKQLDQIRNPKLTQEKYAKQKDIAPHWLFVR